MDLTAASRTPSSAVLRRAKISARIKSRRRREILGPVREFTISPVTSWGLDLDVILSFGFEPHFAFLRCIGNLLRDSNWPTILIRGLGSEPESVMSSTNRV